jgi:hypothetical protein
LSCIVSVSSTWRVRHAHIGQGDLANIALSKKLSQGFVNYPTEGKIVYGSFPPN